MATDNTIYFHSRTKDYNVFDNFIPAPCPVTIDEKVWPTSEHYFQAQKFHGTDQEEDVRLSKTPMEAKMKGRTYKLRDDWEQVKDDAMRKAVYAKNLQDILLSTGNKDIVEDAMDFYWGIGDGSGKNALGKILVSVRNQIRDELHAANNSN